MLLLRPLALACGLLRLLSHNNTISTNISSGLRCQDTVTDDSPVPDVLNVRDNVLEEATRKESQDFAARFVPATALMVWLSPPVQPTGRHVVGAMRKIALDALCTVGIYCDTPAPVRSPASNSVPSPPPSSPAKSASLPVKAASSSGKPARASGHGFFTLKLTPGHWFSDKSFLVSSFCTLDFNARWRSAFGIRWCKVGNKHAPNARRPGPPPNTCTLPDLDRCGVGARYLEPIPLVIPLRSSTGYQLGLRELTVGISMVALTLLVICLARPGSRSKLSFALWWLISSFIYGILRILDTLCFIVFLPFLIVEVLSDGLSSLFSSVAQVTQPPRCALDDETAKKYYDEIVTAGLPLPLTHAFGTLGFKTTVELEESASKNTRNRVDNTPIAPTTFKGTPAGSTPVETATTGAHSTQPTTPASNLALPSRVKPKSVHIESLRYTSTPTPASTTLVAMDPIPTLVNTVPAGSSQPALSQPVASESPSHLADTTEDKNENMEEAEKDKGYEPDSEYDQYDEDEDEDDDQPEENSYYNTEDNGFECGHCRSYCIKLAIAACEETKRAPATYTESAPPHPAPTLTIPGMALSATTCYTEANAIMETSIGHNLRAEFVNPFVICFIPTPISSFSAGFKHRRVQSAPMQLTSFRSDSTRTASPADIIPSKIPIDATNEDKAKSSNGVPVSASTTTFSHGDNGDDEESMKDEEAEEPSGCDQATTTGICANIAVTALPVEAIDTEDVENKSDSSAVSVIPADITFGGESQDEDKTRNDDTSKDSSDDEEFMGCMCEMIEAAVPMAKSSSTESTPAEVVPDTARVTPAPPATPEVPRVATTAQEDIRSRVCSSAGMVVPRIVIMPSTPPAPPVATPGPSSSLATASIVSTVPSKPMLSSKEKDDILAALEEEEEEELEQQAKRAANTLRDRWRSRI
ncbi:hypothetical protein FS749_005184 [Ceratobasidium sp. UAMH 11750]|nr:hypothetical protein FS749_005184 [Ceratobasidium sp. UAMH 11750]